MSRTTESRTTEATTDTCRYLSLYDAEHESLTDWAETLVEDFDEVVEESATIKRDLEMGLIDAAALFEREGVDRESVSDGTVKRLIKADRTRQAAGLPATCPHEPYDGEPHCVFHLAPDRCDELGIEPATVRARLLTSLDDESEAAGHGKCFAGGRFRELVFPYRTLESRSNRPLQLHYAHIGELNLDNAVVDERLVLDGSTVESCSAENVRFRRAVSFERATLDCDSLSFDGSVFEEAASFRDATVTATRLRFQDCSFERGCSFVGADFELALSNTDDNMDPIRFNDTDFDGGLACDDASFSLRDFDRTRRQVAVKLPGCRFGGPASFDDCEFGTVSGTDGESLEGARLSDDPAAGSSDDITWKVQFKDAAFDGGFQAAAAELAGTLRMRDTEFRGDRSSFEGMTIDGELLLAGAEFSQGAVTFANVSVQGDDMNCTEASFGGSTLVFAGATVDGEAAFKGLSFAGSEARFTGFEVGGSLDLEGAVFDAPGGDIDFTDLTVDDELNLRQATFTGNGIDFRDTTVRGSSATDGGATAADCVGSVWSGGEIDFSDSEFGAEADWELATFSGDLVRFTRMRVDGDTSFHHAEFETTETDLSEITVTGDRFEMSHAQLGEQTVFNDAELLADVVDLQRLRADGVVVEFRRIESGETLVDFRNATVTDGKFEIGPQDTVYGFEDATIGDIDIELGDGEGKLLEHFVFKNTEFDGFDFSRDNIKQELQNTGWKIHTTHGETRPRGFIERQRDRLARYSQLASDGPSEDGVDPNELETTYMRAKLGADQQGDPDAVSQFFQKELQFRRRAHGHRFWDRRRGVEGKSTYGTLKSKTRTAWDWIANTTLGLTVGYGERPGNVVITSLIIVLTFAFVYRGINALPQGSNSLDYLTYSFQGFIQLVVGIQTTGSILVRFFTAVEGFLGAFTIALFVITLTRSIDR